MAPKFLVGVYVSVMAWAPKTPWARESRKGCLCRLCQDGHTIKRISLDVWSEDAAASMISSLQATMASVWPKFSVVDPLANHVRRRGYVRAREALESP